MDQTNNLSSDSLEPSIQRSGTPSWLPEDDSIGRLIKLLKKRSLMVVAMAAIGLAIGFTANLVLTKLYKAKSLIEVTPDKSSEFRVEQIQAAAGGGEVNSEKIETEIEILKSSTLALDTINSLHLERNPNFLKLVDGRPWDLSSPRDRFALIATFQRDLTVVRLGHTNIIQIYVTSRQPELGMLIANTLIDKYIEHTFQDSYSSTQKISAWLGTQLGGLKDNLQNSQARMVKLQRDSGIVGIDQQQSVIVSKLEELNKELADAQVDRMLKESQVKAFQGSDPDVVDALSPSYLSLQNSKANLFSLKSEYASMSQTYGPSYVRLKELKAQIDQLQASISATEQALISRAQKELDASRNNENTLRSTLDAEEQKAYDNGPNVIQYELARREYQSNRELYDGLQERLLEAGIEAGLHSTSVHIVDNADVPTYPDQPHVTLNLVGGFGISLFLGLVLAVLLEAMDTHLKTIPEVEEVSQLPLLAAIPKVDSKILFPETFGQHARSGEMGAWSQIAEALRGLRTSILLSTPGSPPKVIMVASTRPAEGKTSISVMTAIMFALNGSRVLLMDADLRRPAIFARLSKAYVAKLANANQSGLASVLSGKATLSDAICEWPDEPGLHVLFSGPTPPLPAELLGSKQMEELLHELRSQYDFIFIDTPPVLTVTDAQILARLADAVLLVVRYGDAQRHVLSRALEVLRRSGAKMLGVVLNVVDLRSPEYSEYYGRKYYSYYGTRNPKKE